MRAAMSQLRLLLVRHGESVANRERRMQGRLDSPLTEKGARQAEAIAERVAQDAPISAVYSSPLLRALETARTIGRRVGHDPVTLDDLMEQDIGDATGMSWEEFEHTWPAAAHALESGDRDARWPGGESRRDVAVRAARVMDLITSQQPFGTVVVVSHGGTLRWAVAHLMSGTPFAHPDHRFDNCAITEVVLGAGGPAIACANDSSHLAEIEEEEMHADREAAG